MAQHKINYLQDNGAAVKLTTIDKLVNFGRSNSLEATARSPAARARGGVRAATARCKTTPLGPPNQPHRVRAFRRGTLPGALEN